MAVHENPKISVIVPIFNAEKYISETIESIIRQSFTDFELILVNDGSTDSSLSICRKFTDTDTRIKILDQPNRGVTIARKNGWKAASGEWIVFVDADDLIMVNCLDTLYSNAIRFNCDIVNGSIVDSENKKWVHKSLGEMNSSIYIQSLMDDTTWGFIAPSIYRKLLFSESCFIADPTIKIGEDLYMNIALAIKAEKALNISDIVYYYRTNPDSVMRQKITHPRYWDRYFCYWVDLFKSNGFNDTLLQKIEVAKLHKQIKSFLMPDIAFDEAYFYQLSSAINNAEAQFGFYHKYAKYFKSKFRFRLLKQIKSLQQQLRCLKKTGRLLKREILY